MATQKVALLTRFAGAVEPLVHHGSPGHHQGIRLARRGARVSAPSAARKASCTALRLSAASAIAEELAARFLRVHSTSPAIAKGCTGSTSRAARNCNSAVGKSPSARAFCARAVASSRILSSASNFEGCPRDTSAKIQSATLQRRRYLRSPGLCDDSAPAAGHLAPS